MRTTSLTIGAALLHIVLADAAFINFETLPARGPRVPLQSYSNIFKEGDEGVSRRQALDASFAVAASGLLLPTKTLAAEDSSTAILTTGKIPSVRLGGGKSSLEISRTIQGYWQLAGGHGSYREVDAIENMKAHFDAGITTLDTADIYGPSELVVGKFVKSQPGAIPCTKFCCFRYLEVSNFRGKFGSYIVRCSYCFPNEGHNPRRGQAAHFKILRAVAS
jgi:Aldo/keto reductase family